MLGDAMRVGGMVKKNSIIVNKKNIQFIVTDFKNDVASVLTGQDWSSNSLVTMMSKASVGNIIQVCAIAAGMDKFCTTKGTKNWNIVHNQIGKYYKAEIKNPFLGKVNKLTLSCLFIFIYCVLCLLVAFLAANLYGLPYSETAFYVSIVIFYKLISSVDILLYSSNIKKIVPYIKGSIYLIMLLVSLAIYKFGEVNIIISIAIYVLMSSLYTLFLVKSVHEK
jgi:hypothetical protein